MQNVSTGIIMCKLFVITAIKEWWNSPYISQSY